jgi:hypothetical protein
MSLSGEPVPLSFSEAVEQEWIEEKVVNIITIRKPGNYNLASFILLKNSL